MKKILLNFIIFLFVFNFIFFRTSSIISLCHFVYGFGPTISIFVSESYLTYLLILNYKSVSLNVCLSNRIILKVPFAVKDKFLSVQFFIIVLYIAYLFIYKLFYHFNIFNFSILNSPKSSYFSKINLGIRPLITSFVIIILFY